MHAHSRYLQRPARVEPCRDKHVQTCTTGANADHRTNTQVHTDMPTVDTQRNKRKNPQVVPREECTRGHKQKYTYTHRYTQRYSYGDTLKHIHRHLEDMHTKDTNRDTHACTHTWIHREIFKNISMKHTWHALGRYTETFT